jgi:NAD(P)-dependent dehydrogenase (short-subunit alcohol dehydrogenase family)
MSENWNWLQDRHADMQPQPGMNGRSMPVFAGQKLVVVGGSSGMGRQTAADVVAAGGSAVIIGEDGGKVEETVQELSKDGGEAYGITADLADRMAAEQVCQQLAAEHADATLLVNAAGLFVPTPFLATDGPAYDSYLDLDRAIFFLTQTVARGMVAGGRGGSIVNIGSMWAHQAIGATPSAAYSAAKGGLHALTKNLALELAPAPDPGQRGRPRRRRHPHLPAVRAREQAGGDAAQLRRVPPAGPDRDGPGPGQHHYLPAVPGHQLGHRRHLGRRRRRDGRPQLGRTLLRRYGGPG